jgi:RNA polymerase sigma-32 factor
MTFQIMEESPPLATAGSRDAVEAGKHQTYPKTNGHHSVPQGGNGHLSEKDETALAGRWRHHGDISARDRLILSHQPLVLGIASRYAAANPAVSLDDLVQAGNIGLLKAVDKFEPAKARLSTYAKWWIGAELKLAVRPERIKTVPIEKDGVSIVADTIAVDPADQEDVATEAIDIGEMRDRLHAIMDEVLDDRERRIFAARVLTDHPPILDVLAKQFGVSRETVRQLEVRATKKVYARAAAPEKIKVSRSQLKLREELAVFYADTLPRHHHHEGWVDGVKRRFPKATAEDRLIAHRVADKIRAGEGAR